MGRFEVNAWNTLSAEQRQAWGRLRAASDAYASPFFDPAFLDAVAAARPDLEALFVRNARGRICAALAFHRDGLGGLIPAAGPLSDWNGFVAAPGTRVDVEAALVAARAHALRLSAAAPADPALSGARWTGDLSHLIDLREGAAAYEAAQSHHAPKPFRNLRHRERRARAQFGEVRVQADDRSPQALAALIAWKQDQYRRTGQFDVFAPDWTRELVERLFQTRTEGFNGRLSTLWFGDRLAAVHFGMQSGARLHWWFPVYDPELAAFSPGLLLLLGVVRCVDELGVDAIDLGPGDYRFKRDLANATLPMAVKTVCRRSLLGRARAAAHAVKRRLPSLPERALRRAYRTWTFKVSPGVRAHLISLLPALELMAV